MKLQSFITEQTLADLDISEYIDNLNPDHAKIIKELLAKFKSFSKIDSTDISSDEMYLHVSNGLIEFDFSFTKDMYDEKNSANAGYDFFPVVEIAAMLNHQIVYLGDQARNNYDVHKIALVNDYSRSFAIPRQDRLFAWVDSTLSAADDFQEWYFDISGKAGKKVKLVKITTDLEDGSSNGVWKWTPYLGQFYIDHNKKTNARVI